MRLFLLGRVSKHLLISILFQIHDAFQADTALRFMDEARERTFWCADVQRVRSST